MVHPIDTWTVVVSTNVARMALTAAVAYCARMHKTYPGFRLWVGGMAVGVLGFFAIALQPVCPGLGILLAHALNTLSVLLLLDGTRRFVLDKSMDRRWYALPLVSAAGGGFFHFVVPSLLARIWWITLQVGGMAAVCGTIWLRGPREGSRRLYHAAAFLSFAYTALLGVRAIALSGAPRVLNLFQPRPQEAAFFLALGLMDMVLLAFYMTLNSERLEDELRQSRAEVKMLSGILPICARCKKIRDEEDHWTQVEDYVRHRTEARFSHGVCPDCFRVLYPDDVDLLEELERSTGAAGSTS